MTTTMGRAATVAPVQPQDEPAWDKPELRPTKRRPGDLTAHLLSPREIAEACRVIQADCPEKERLRREQVILGYNPGSTKEGDDV